MIKIDITMPESCSKCPFKGEIEDRGHGGGGTFNKCILKFIPSEDEYYAKFDKFLGRHKDCKLIEE